MAEPSITPGYKLVGLAAGSLSVVGVLLCPSAFPNQGRREAARDEEDAVNATSRPSHGRNYLADTI